MKNKRKPKMKPLKKAKKNLLATLADKNYIEQAKQLFSSAYWNAGWKGDYMLLAHEIPEEGLKWFRDKGILIKKCKPLYTKDKLKKLYKEYPGKRTLNYLSVILDKFYLFTPEFKKYKNIIYLDLDVIVNASIDTLSKVKGFGAVRDFPKKLKKQFLCPNKILFNKLKKKYNLEETAFNAGVLAFNTDIIKKDAFSRLKKLFEKYNKIQLNFEQNTLNLFFYKKWTSLPLAYNLDPFRICHPLTIKPSKNKIIILHFSGNLKPWNIKNPFYQKWKHNLEKAELIEINKPINNSKKYTEKEIQKYSKYARKRIFFYSPICFLDKLIGLMGTFLKKYFPRVYKFLK